MAGKGRKSQPPGNYRMLTAIWLIGSALLAYPAWTWLVSLGLNKAIAATIVFVGICLLYDIPHRARVRAENEEARRKASHWRGRSY
ncbi:MAG TPA: hypothetical protein PKC23_13055 [Candidatus Desulfobacillus sp.]|nr:hypothetical protein [Candidatus Desulfobacillus sp.]